MTFRTHGIIIRKKDFREYDRLFTIYTKEHGKIVAMGQGTRKLSSKLSGNLEFLNTATFTIAKGKQIDRIATVDPRDSYEDVKGSLEKLVIASYCLEIVDQVVREEQPDLPLYVLLEEFLETLRRVEDGRRIATAKFFLLKFIATLGILEQSDAQLERIATHSLASLLPQRIKPHFDTILEGFVADHCPYPLKSQEYFSFVSGK